MSYDPLPKRVDPRKLADRNVTIKGHVEAEQMPRLRSLLCDSRGGVDAELMFSVDEQKLRIVTGNAAGHVFMTCQRCLEPVEVEVHAELNLAITLTDEHVKNLPRKYDPLPLEEEDVSLVEVLEEDLLLSLPPFAYHDDCSVETSYGKIEAAQETKPNPFSVLAELKANKTSK
ncbi:MAG: YceD family protein [Pontibacterium sp.]